MVKPWIGDIVIHAPIDRAWMLFDNSEAHVQKIIPNVVSHTLLEKTSDIVGSRYLQKYVEGKRSIEYVVTVHDYLDTPDFKKIVLHFRIPKCFDVLITHSLTRTNDSTTAYHYRVEHKPLVWWLGLTLFLGQWRVPKMVAQHLDRVKKAAESL